MDLKGDIAMMRGGRMVMLINGEMLIMEADVITPEGIKVLRDGTILMPDGRNRMLREDEAVIIDRVTTMMEEK